jgi:hypothetical protein
VAHCEEGGGCLRPALPATHNGLLSAPEQGQLTLLGIEAHQRPDNLFLYQDLVFRIPSVELPALNPLGVALLPEGQFPLGFGNLFSK